MISPEASAALYHGVRERVIAAAREFDEEQLATHVPGCPEWTVRDLLAHQAGVARDFVDGNLTGAPSDAWTAVHVDSRRDRPVAEVLAEWERYGAELEGIIRSGERRGRLLNNPYVDAGVHQADLHGAIGTGRPSREVWLAALDFCRAHAKGDEPGALTILTEDGSYTFGTGAPVVDAKVDGYELFRATFGRRTPAQIASWAWNGDPAPWTTDLPRLPQTTTPLTD